MDARKALHEHSLHTQVERHERRMLTRGALAVVLAAHHNARAILAAALREFLVAHAEAEVRQIGDVGAERQDLRARRHDVVGGDVVAHLEQRLHLKALRQSVCHREFLDVRAAQDLHFVHLVRRRRRHDHVVVDEEVLRHLHLRLLAERARVGEHAGQSGNGRRLRAHQVNLTVSRAGTALKVAVEGAQRNAVRIRGLPHADARAASTFEHACAGAHNVGQRAVFRQHVVNLAAAGRNRQAHVRVHGLALEDGSDVHEIEVRGIRAGTDADLIHLDRANGIHGLHIVRAVRAGNHRHEGGEIHSNFLVIDGVRIRSERNPVLLAVLRLQESARHFIGGEDGGCRAEFRAHVRDGSTFRHRQRGDAFAGILHDLAHASLHGEDLEHLQDDVLCRNPGGEAACQVDAQHLRHGNVIRTAAHGHSHVKPAGAHRQHADAAARGGVAVGADERLARNAEALQVHLVADAVARP